MAFKKTSTSKLVPDSPEKLFLDLPRRKIPSVMPHQKEIMQTYAQEGVDAKDVALQLPTGSGKTLVGLLIGEWRRRKFDERVVYLCPTRQLVNQVVEQAHEKYGLTVLGFTGQVKEYKPSDKARYNNAEHIAVTTYNSLFNTNPFFNDADIIIIDDAHAAENYVVSLWNLTINRTDEHKILYTAFAHILRPILDPVSYARLMGKSSNISDVSWVDKVPTPDFCKIHDQIIELLDEHAPDSDLKYSWSMIRESLSACHLYISSNQILIRPLIPPTWTHAPFDVPKQRIYMSATLGAGGDLERLLGRRDIKRLSVPEGWKRQGVGRRFFIFPSMSLIEAEQEKLRIQLMKKAGRSLVLVPSDKMAQDLSDNKLKKLDHKIFDAADIEQSKSPFISEDKAVAIVANRYDGIDFPGDECRLLFIEGLPKAMNIQERFFMSRMGAISLYNERVQTRILQAIGRCTRSLEDYSAVVVSGEELPDYLSDKRRNKFMHRELQAEIRFGVEQSIDTSVEDIIENFQIFIENDENWEDVNEQIVGYRKEAHQEAFPALDQLNDVVKDEVRYQEKMWQEDYEEALAYAEKVLAKIGIPELKGYRALWHYLAGSAAWLGAEKGISGYLKKARAHYASAKKSANNIPWLVTLSRFQEAPEIGEKSNINIMSQIENLESVLTHLGTSHERRFAAREKEILDGLENEEKFENAHKLLGEILGFSAGKDESRGSPDPWWILNSYCFVFEDHAGAKPTSKLDVTKSRQAATHPNWIVDNVEEAKKCEIIPVLITPVKKIEKEAGAHLKHVSVWGLDEFKGWAVNALAVVREVRQTFSEAGDLAWRANTAELFERHQIDVDSIYKKIKEKIGNHNLKLE